MTTRVRLLRPILIALAVTILAAVAFGVALVRHRKVLAPVAQTVLPSPERAFGKSRLSLLILGIDYDYTETGLPSSKNARSDTIMAVSLDFPARTARVLSVPRDMVATFPDGSRAKINAAFADGGAREAQHVIANFLGLPGGFDRYIVLRVSAAKDLIDAVGGLDITPDETMDYDDNWGHLHIHFKRGTHYHMDGTQAVSYSRFRHDACGDPCRIRRQQDVIRHLVAKVTGDRLNDLTHVAALVNVLRRDVDTDVKPSEAISLTAHYAQTNMRDLRTAQVPFADNTDLPGLGSVLIADEHQKRLLVRRMFVDPIPVPNVRPCGVPTGQLAPLGLSGTPAVR